MAQILLHRNGFQTKFGATSNPIWRNIEEWTAMAGPAQRLSDHRVINRLRHATSDDLSTVDWGAIRTLEIGSDVTGTLGSSSVIQLYKIAKSTGAFVDVVNYLTYIELSESELDDAVPDYLPYGKKFDEEGQPAGTKTWAEWSGSHSITRKANGRYYVSSAAGVPGNHPLAASVFVQLDDDNFQIKSLEEFQALEDVPAEE